MIKISGFICSTPDCSKKEQNFIYNKPIERHIIQGMPGEPDFAFKAGGAKCSPQRYGIQYINMK